VVDNIIVDGGALPVGALKSRLPKAAAFLGKVMPNDDDKWRMDN
jgi:hypothetical protein